MSGAALTFMSHPSPICRASYLARWRQWQFLIVDDAEAGWTVSYRLVAPRGAVSVASTIKGPFASFAEAADEAEAMRRRLGVLS